MEITFDSIIGILGLLLGGGAGGFFTWRWQREKAKAEAKEEGRGEVCRNRYGAEGAGHLPADTRRQAEGGGRQPPAHC